MARLVGRSRVWGRGYTTIPVTVRRILDLREGDLVEWYMADDGSIFVRPGVGRGGDEG